MMSTKTCMGTTFSIYIYTGHIIQYKQILAQEREALVLGPARKEIRNLYLNNDKIFAGALHSMIFIQEKIEMFHKLLDPRWHYKSFIYKRTLLYRKSLKGRLKSRISIHDLKVSIYIYIIS